MPDYTFPRKLRLKSQKSIDRLFAEGRGGVIFPLRYIVATEEEGEEGTSQSLQVLVTVSKRYHKRANVRNLLKRRMREAYRLNRSLLGEETTHRVVSLGLLYISKEVSDFATIEHAVQRILQKLSKRG